MRRDSHLKIEPGRDRVHRDRQFASARVQQSDSGHDTSRSEEVLEDAGSLARADAGARERALSSVQASHGNAAVQRLAEGTSHDTAPGAARAFDKVARRQPGLPVQCLFDGVGEWLTGAASDVGGTALAGLTGIGSALADAGGGLRHGLFEGVGAMTDSGMGVGRAVVGGYGAFTDAGGGIVEAMLGGGGPSGVLDAAVGGAGRIAGAAGGLWDALSGHAGATRGAWTGVGSALSSGVSGVADAVWGGATDVLSAFGGAAGRAHGGLGGALDPSLWQHGVTLGPKPKHHWSRRPEGEVGAEQPLSAPPAAPKPQMGERLGLISPEPHDPMHIHAGDNRSDEDGPDYDYWGRLINETAFAQLRLHR